MRKSRRVVKGDGGLNVVEERIEMLGVVVVLFGET